MLLRSVQYMHDRHVITAGELGYASLIGTWSRRYPGGYWANNVALPGRERWPLTLYHLQSHVVSAGGSLIGGMGCKLLELVESDSDPVMDLAAGFQDESGKVVFSGAHPVDYGFGVVYWPPLMSGWVVMTRATYVVRMP